MRCAGCALLSVERIAYVLIWRNPAGVPHGGQCVASSLRSEARSRLLVILFGAFKLIQIAVFLAWHLRIRRRHVVASVA